MNEVGIPPDLVVHDGVFAMADLWHLPTDQWSKIWERATGKSIKIAILDTGIVDHPNLPKPVAAKSFIRGEDVRDGNGHGSHVAGTAAGRGGIGVAPEANLIVGKVLSDSGSGSSDGIANGILWATDEGADIISMSLGGGSSYGPTNRAIDRAFSRGCIVNAAAGNSGFSGGRNTVGWPAKYTGCLCNGATRRDGQIAYFSSGGQELDWATPGQDIISASIRGGLVSMSGTCLLEGSYVYTPDGPSKIENIIPGDVVYAYSGGRLVQRAVRNKWLKGTNDVLAIQSAGRVTHATPTHKFLVVDSKMRDLDWVEAQNLRPHHGIVMPKQVPSRTNKWLDSTISLDFAWMLGFFMGDGWISDTTRGMRVCFAVGTDKRPAQRAAMVYRRITGRSMGESSSGDWLYGDHSMLAMMIQTLGMRKPARDKEFPAWYWHLSRDKQLQFLDGYFEADGSIKGDAVRLGCTSRSITEGMLCAADYLGWSRGSCYRTEQDVIAPANGKTYHNVLYRSSLTRRSGPEGWSLIRTRRDTSAAGKEVAAAMGLDVGDFNIGSACWNGESSGVGRVYDIEVPDADCFVANNQVVHNSMATPMGSGVLALIVQLMRQAGQPQWTAIDAVREFFKQWCEDRGQQGHDPRFGWGVPKYDEIIKALQYDEIRWI